ncbi:type II toxin-antitoxin system HicA family toxin [Cupriavidus basilensis]|uniref:type II toxin-antitoxin system HicA family toxin n=1 Tax=Cupriavidus basilensis TaxID=68895 RepID=UPI00283B1268|nr:type II toxin-antitoxin system HicA family toxin [Cupriavidus basilensis]MDR3381718.1 type II toxin-antitoxin system HicA family toxin [Cupriavidus basilensis]
MNSSELIRMLEQDGWREVRTKGSHHHFKHPTKQPLVTVPHPKKDLPLGTVRSILKTAGL